MASWIHCNQCFTLSANSSSKLRLWFTSCGHLLCAECLKAQRANNGIETPFGCLVCHQQNIKLVELNRHLRPDLMALFRPPKDLLEESSAKLKKVVAFQQSQQQRYLAHSMNKCKKATKFARAMQAEVAKRDERVNMLETETSQLKTELEQMEKMLKEREHEILRLRKSPRKRAYPSLNGNTPITSLSFLGCGAMSTPNNVVEQHNIETLFRTQNVQEETPLAGPAFCPTTPYLFAMAGSGINEKHTPPGVTPKYF